jgi:hypothetical protein
MMVYDGNGRWISHDGFFGELATMATVMVDDATAGVLENCEVFEGFTTKIHRYDLRTLHHSLTSVIYNYRINIYLFIKSSNAAN